MVREKSLKIVDIKVDSDYHLNQLDRMASEVCSRVLRAHSDSQEFHGVSLPFSSFQGK